MKVIVLGQSELKELLWFGAVEMPQAQIALAPSVTLPFLIETASDAMKEQSLQQVEDSALGGEAKNFLEYGM